MQAMAPTSRAIYTAIALVADDQVTYLTRVGKASKQGGRLLSEDQPWEARFDNGYPNVLPPTSAKGSWQIWYGDCVAGCAVQLLLYANSTDGITWQKPSLGLFDVGKVRSDLKSIGTANNIVLEGGGIGVWRDERGGAHNKFVAFGPGRSSVGLFSWPCVPSGLS